MNADPRDPLGRLVREAWIRWAREQPDPKPSWLVPWEDLGENQREADMQIGKAVARHAAEEAARRILAHMEACGPQSPPGEFLAAHRWRRHFRIAARVASRAFLTGDDEKRMAAEALARGDFAVCEIPEVPGG